MFATQWHVSLITQKTEILKTHKLWKNKETHAKAQKGDMQTEGYIIYTVVSISSYLS